MDLLIQVVSGITIGCIYGLVALGFSMIYRAIGLVNFAQGDIMMLGAFLGYTSLAVAPKAPFIVVLLIAMAATALFGVVIERVAFRPAINRGAGLIYLVLLTLGIGIVLSNAARLVWGANPVVYKIPLTHDVTKIAGYPLPTVYFYILGVVAVLIVLLNLFFTRTWTGLALRALSQDRDTAALMGVHSGPVSSVAFAIASALGAAAGVLYAPLFFVSFDLGVIGIKAFAAAVVGTLGHLPGALIGGLVIGIAETFGGRLIASEYQDSIAFATMILVLLFRPNGLFAPGGVR